MLIIHPAFLQNGVAIAHADTVRVLEMLDHVPAPAAGHSIGIRAELAHVEADSQMFHEMYLQVPSPLAPVAQYGEQWATMKVVESSNMHFLRDHKECNSSFTSQ